MRTYILLILGFVIITAQTARSFCQDPQCCCGEITWSLSTSSTGGICQGQEPIPKITTWQYNPIQCKDGASHDVIRTFSGWVVGTGGTESLPECTPNCKTCTPTKQEYLSSEYGRGVVLTVTVSNYILVQDIPSDPCSWVCVDSELNETEFVCPCTGCCTAAQHGGCNGWLDCNCFCHPTPILISFSDNQLWLSSAGEGVRFDVDGDGALEQVAWTRAEGTDDGFLVLDRNGNGIVDDGTEMFGGCTPQSESEEPNGFLALAEFDRPENGGNSDGVITPADSVWGSLRIWLDANHNAYSESGELYHCFDIGLESISLDYRLSNKHDEYGNIFRYRSQAQIDGRNRWAYDVIFDIQE